MAWICGQPPLTILSIGSVTIHSGLGLELRAELLDGPGEAGVLEGAPLDLADRVQDGGVIAAVEGLCDGRQGEIGELASQVHRELAGLGDGSGASGREDGVDAEAETGGDGFLDLA